MVEAIHAAHAAGFDAVECHWPYSVSAEAVLAALTETGLPMLGLNTERGGDGMFGLCALPDKVEDARQSIDQAIETAAAISANAVHVMAGASNGSAAEACFLASLEYACVKAQPLGLTVLIEPLNAYDAPGYFLGNQAQACAIVEKVGAENLKVMFDCYHVARTEGDVLATLKDTLPVVGHIQFAGVPDRGDPATGTVNYRDIFAEIAAMGWDQPLGAEYKPGGPTERSLGWMQSLR
ncbi:MAG: TIM barrel protein [Pseudomonadota bacterium]